MFCMITSTWWVDNGIKKDPPPTAVFAAAIHAGSEPVQPPFEEHTTAEEHGHPQQPHHHEQPQHPGRGGQWLVSFVSQGLAVSIDNGERVYN